MYFISWMKSLHNLLLQLSLGSPSILALGHQLKGAYREPVVVWEAGLAPLPCAKAGAGFKQCLKSAAFPSCFLSEVQVPHPVLPIPSSFCALPFFCILPRIYFKLLCFFSGLNLSFYATSPSSISPHTSRCLLNSLSKPHLHHLFFPGARPSCFPFEGFYLWGLWVQVVKSKDKKTSFHTWWSLTSSALSLAWNFSAFN